MRTEAQIKNKLETLKGFRDIKKDLCETDLAVVLSNIILLEWILS